MTVHKILIFHDSWLLIKNMFFHESWFFVSHAFAKKYFAWVMLVHKKWVPWVMISMSHAFSSKMWFSMSHDCSKTNYAFPWFTIFCESWFHMLFHESWCPTTNSKWSSSHDFLYVMRTHNIFMIGSAFWAQRYTCAGNIITSIASRNADSVSICLEEKGWVWSEPWPFERVHIFPKNSARSVIKEWLLADFQKSC